MYLIQNEKSLVPIGAYLMLGSIKSDMPNDKTRCPSTAGQGWQIGLKIGQMGTEWDKSWTFKGHINYTFVWRKDTVAMLGKVLKCVPGQSNEVKMGT